MYRTDLVLNPTYAPGASYGSAQRALLNSESIADVKAEVTAWPGYESTPLVRLDSRAKAAGIARLWCKYEAPRFGIGSFKPAGPTYAMLTVIKGEVRKATGVNEVTTKDLVAGRFESITRNITISAATSGNHGRALAWGARLFHCRCLIYMSETVSPGREQVIASFGAEVVRVPGSFDRAVRRSADDAEEHGYFVVCDKQRVYPEVPLQIIQGYALVGDEIADQLQEKGEEPTHVFVPAGSGSMASAVCGRLWERYGSAHPRLITVEPEASVCLQQSAREGRPAEIADAVPTILDGLVVNEASHLGWTILRAGAFAFLSVEDQAAIDAMRQAAEGSGGDPALVIGDTGSAGWAGFLAATSDPQLRRDLELTDDSRVVLVVTEGATDPEVYRTIVGRDPEEVMTAWA